MVGREFYHNPFLLANLDNRFFCDNNSNYKSDDIIKRSEIINKMAEYCDFILSDNKLNINLRRKYKIKIAHIAKSLLGLYSGEKNGKVWRGYLGDKMHKVGDLGYLGDYGGDLLRESLVCFD